MCILKNAAVGPVRNAGTALAAGALIAASVLAGCSSTSSTATGYPRAASTRPAASGASPAVGPGVFSSPYYSYTVALPAGWSAQGAQPWHGPGTPGLEGHGVDVFHGPPYVVAWAFAAKPASLAGYAAAIARAAAQLPCPAVPQLEQQVTIGGAPGTLVGMSCPSQGGVFMLTAAATHNQTALVFVFQDSSGTVAAEHGDRLAFRALLASLRFR
jgi:hypothetical protein